MISGGKNTEIFLPDTEENFYNYSVLICENSPAACEGRWGTSCDYTGLLPGCWFSGAGRSLLAAKRASATAGGIHKFSTLMTVVEDYFS